jgi:hypothetical protein
MTGLSQAFREMCSGRADLSSIAVSCLCTYVFLLLTYLPCLPTSMCYHCSADCESCDAAAATTMAALHRCLVSLLRRCC